MLNSRTLFSALLLFIFAVGCTPVATQTMENEPQTMEPVEEDAIVAETPLPTAVSVPTATEVLPTQTVTPSVRITAVNGNLHIRRGPDTAYDRIGILKSATTANVIGQDVLSKWVQIQIPGTELTGWVSLLTPYSQIDGDLKDVHAFTFTEWPEPAFIKNCTEHDLIIMPNELYLYSLWTNAQYLNQSQIDPGFYEVRDASLEGEPLIENVDIKEGQTYYVTMNGLDEYHNCPENN